MGPRYSPGQQRFEYISNWNEFKLLQNLSKFDRSKNGFEAPEKMNNFLHRNLFRFGTDFN
jgi:hypothetical protein